MQTCRIDKHEQIFITKEQLMLVNVIFWVELSTYVNEIIFCVIARQIEFHALCK